jgi:hypothetical protein
MSYRKSLITMAVVLSALVIFVPVAQAERQSFEGISCCVNTITPVQASPGEIYVGSFEGKCIQRSTKEKMLGDNGTVQQIGIVKTAGGKFFWNGFTKHMMPDGDIGISEFNGDSESGSTGKMIYGTGKWKGAKGEWKAKQITTGKPIIPNTEQVCTKYEGWVEFAK